MKRKQLFTRSITGLFFGAILIGSILFSPYTLSFLFFLFALIGMDEFFKLHAKEMKGLNLFAFLSGALIYFASVSPSLFNSTNYLLQLIILLVPILLVFELFKKGNSIRTSSISALSWFYIVLPFSLLTLLAFVRGYFDPCLVLAFFFLIWTNDTGAYLSGSLFGKLKLAPSISPGKTLEGFIGGVLLTLSVSWIISRWLVEIHLKHWLFMALIVSVFGTLGDLVQSKMKRIANVKDSGKLMPGHGGVLDRFDGVLVSLPLVYVYIEQIILKT